MSPSNPSRGQILVIFAGGLLLLLAIAALVIDLGFVFMLRRLEQNIADPAAIAAARHIRPAPNKPMMDQAACQYARLNGLFEAAADNTGCLPANDSMGTTLTVHYPPSGAAGQFAGRPGFVEVVVSRPHETFFGRVLGILDIQVTSAAVAAFSDGDSNSNSLIALDDGGCGGNAAGGVSGGSSVTITPTIDPNTGLPYDGGYVHVNSSCGSAAMVNGVCGNGEGSGALKIDGSGSSLSAPHVYTVGTCVKSNNNSFSSPLTEGAVEIGDPLADLPPPDIDDYPAGWCNGVQTTPTGPDSRGCKFNSAGTYSLQPGVFYGGWEINNNVTLQLEAGIYIIAGGGIKLNAGGSITSVSSTTGTAAPILIFSTDNPNYPCPGSPQYACQGSIDFTASSTLTVTGIDSGPYKGMLLWQDGNGSDPDASVTLGGQTNLNIAGTIYAPKAQVKVTGGSSGSGVAAIQIIAWQFDLGGGGTLLMPYDPKQLYSFEQKGLVR